MLKEYALEIDKLHAQLWAAREKEGVYLPMQQYREMERELAEVKLRPRIASPHVSVLTTSPRSH